MRVFGLLCALAVVQMASCAEVQVLEEAGLGEGALLGAMERAQSELAKVCISLLYLITRAAEILQLCEQ